MSTKRQTPAGWAYVVKRAKIRSKPWYFTFESEEEGDAYVAKLELMLDKGVMPPELLEGAAKHTILAEVIRGYIMDAPVPDSDMRVLNVVTERIGTTPLSAVNIIWAERWITSMKRERNLAPGTIKHHVGALRRCFDWGARRNIVALIANPLNSLPVRYANYSPADTMAAKAVNEKFSERADEKRDRRLRPGEEEKFRALTLYDAPFNMLFEVALETAMRMREIYTLTLDQVNFEARTIFLDKTKNGSKRQVPMSSTIMALLREYIDRSPNEKVMGGYSITESKGRLFPWWNGSFDKNKLIDLTSRLSHRFAYIFEKAGSPDFRFHDLRHEGTSRYVEKTKLDVYKIMQITGHSDIKTFNRYANLRGSDFAKELW